MCSKSIINALQYIKKKKNTFTTLSKSKLGYSLKGSKRATGILDRDLERSPKKIN